MSIVYSSALNKITINNICDTAPLDKLKKDSADRQALPYVIL